MISKLDSKFGRLVDGCAKKFTDQPFLYLLPKKVFNAVSMKCVLFLYFILSTCSSISFIKSVGNRTVTFCVSLVRLIYQMICNLQVNINNCTYMQYIARQLNFRGCGYGTN